MRSSKFILFVFALALFLSMSEVVDAAAISPSIFTRTLKRGSVGADVRALQIFLNSEGYVVAQSGIGSPGHETTYFGLATKNALIRFQNAHADRLVRGAGLTRASGLFGAFTKAVVTETLNGSDSSAVAPFPPPAQNNNGIASLPPGPPPATLEASLLGVLPIVQNANDIITRVAPLDPNVPSVTATLAYVANAISGLTIVNVSSPTNPTIIGSAPLPFVAESEVSSLSLSGNILAMVGYQSIYENGTTRSAFLCHLVDVSNPNKPRLVGKIDNGQHRLSAPVISGQYLYLMVGSEGIVIYDISDPAMPRLVGSYDTPGYAWAMKVQGSYGYIADGLQGVHILDLTNPVSPQWVSTTATEANVADISMKDNYIYTAEGRAVSVIDMNSKTHPVVVNRYPTLLPAGAAAKQLKISGNTMYIAIGSSGFSAFDISNPLVPTSKYILSPTGGPTSATKGIYILDGKAYLANYGGGIAIISGTDTATPTQVAQINKWYVGKKVAYVGPNEAVVIATRYEANGTISMNSLLLVNTTDAAKPVIEGAIEIKSLTFKDVTVSGENIFVAAGLQGVLVFKLADMRSGTITVNHDSNGDGLVDGGDPHIVAYYDTPNFSSSITVNGNYAYTAEGNPGMRILTIDLANPAKENRLRSSGLINTPTNAVSIAISPDGNTAYVGDTASLIIYNIENKSVTATTLDAETALRRGRYMQTSTSQAIQQIQLQGNIAYVTTRSSIPAEAGLQLIDVQNPATPTLISRIPTTGGPNLGTLGVAVRGNRAYIANYDGGVGIIDIGTPGNPAQMGSVPGPSNVNGIAIDPSTGMVFGADDLSGLILVGQASSAPSETQAPTTPTNLSASPVSSSRINLAWTASTDNVAVVGYKIYRGGNLIGVSTTNSYSDQGLSANTSYTYTVAAYDAIPNLSPQSTSASATTPPLISVDPLVLAQYKFAGNFQDSSGHGYNGVAVNGTTLGSNGTVNWAQFDGENDYVDVATPPSLSSGTISFWIKPDSDGTIFQSVISKDVVALEYRIGITKQQSGWSIKLYSGLTTPSSSFEPTIGSLPLDNNWHQIVWVRTPSFLQQLYVDGVFAGEMQAASQTYRTGTDPLHIGTGYPVTFGTAGGYRFFKGKISNIEIRSNTLSASDVQAAYNQQAPSYR